MLNGSTAFLSFSTHKLFETQSFYRDILELEVELINNKFIHLFLPSGDYVVIYFREDHKPASYTLLNFQVTGIESIVDKLVDRGVSFLRYLAPIQTDEKGISWDDQGSHLAWFKDPGGNILSLIEN